MGKCITGTYNNSWGHHQMETFSALLAICARNSPVTSEFPAQRPVTRSFDVFFDLRQHKRLSKQWQDWWFEMPSHLLWRLCNVIKITTTKQSKAKLNTMKSCTYSMRHTIIVISACTMFIPLALPMDTAADAIWFLGLWKCELCMQWILWME